MVINFCALIILPYKYRLDAICKVCANNYYVINFLATCHHLLKLDNVKVDCLIVLTLVQVNLNY